MHRRVYAHNFPILYEMVGRVFWRARTTCIDVRIRSVAPLGCDRKPKSPPHLRPRRPRRPRQSEPPAISD